MSVRNLGKLLSPHRVAVIGASSKPGTVGATVLQNMVGSGFAGVVYPVNHKHESVHGIQCYPSIADLPQTPDLAVICTPAATVPDVVRQCGEAGILGVLIISAGFGETGAAGRELEERVAAEAAKFDGLRIIGPNCLGLVMPHLGLNATFAKGLPKAGNIAFISQSGALGTAVLDWALRTGIGFSGFVSIGNTLDVDFADLIDYFGNDGKTKSIILYVESVSDAHEFISAARAFTRTKPIVAYKGGRFGASAAAVASHTGAMAGEDIVYEAAFERAGIVRVHGMMQMFQCAEVLARQTPPDGDRLAIVTNAGGPAVIATDTLVGANGKLAALDPATVDALDEFLPAHWSHRNPVDVLGDASPERLAHALELTLKDDNVDAALVILAPQAMTDPTETARAVATIAKHAHKLVLGAWIGGPSMEAGTQVLVDAGVATYVTPEGGVQAYLDLVRYTSLRRALHETPRTLVRDMPAGPWRTHSLFDRFENDGTRGPLTEAQTKEFLADYGITVNPTVAADSADRAVAEADRLGYPVVLKINSHDITHKTDVGGVVLNLRNADAVREAFNTITTRAREACPDATILGVTVQPMVTAAHSLEMILGARKDATFGTAVMLGMGGTAAELYRDRAVGLPPLNESLTRRMLRSLRTWPMLTGYRGRPPLDVDALTEQVIRFSYLLADHPEIAELDINPLLVHRNGVVALDGRIVLDPTTRGRALRPYEHLAIHPYPEQYVRPITLADGSGVTLRPICPEDEPLWHDMLAACSAESLWFRFRSIFKETTHVMASRYCFIDYQREMAIVAEVGSGTDRRLVGVGRFICDPDRINAEYAVLITDEWQNRGLGSRITDFCLEIAQEWGVQTVLAETSRENHKMLALLKARDFNMTYDESSEVLTARGTPRPEAPSPALA